MAWRMLRFQRVAIVGVAGDYVGATLVVAPVPAQSTA